MHYQIYTSSIRSQSAIIQLDRLQNNQSYMNLFRGFSSYALPASDGQHFGAIWIFHHCPQNVPETDNESTALCVKSQSYILWYVRKVETLICPTSCG